MITGNDYEYTDFDRDTHNELIIESDQQNLYIDPEHGGTLFEWDLRRSNHNLMSVMTRREESYHQTLREYEQDRRRHAHHITPTSGQDAERTRFATYDRSYQRA